MRYLNTMLQTDQEQQDYCILSNYCLPLRQLCSPSIHFGGDVLYCWLILSLSIQSSRCLSPFLPPSLTPFLPSSLYFIDYATTVVLISPPLLPSTQHPLHLQAIPPSLFISMGHVYKLFHYSISYTVMYISMAIP